MDSIHALISAPLPTERLRPFNAYVWSLGWGHNSCMQSLDVFSQKRVVSVTSGFSRAAFRRLEAHFVRGLDSIGLSFSVTAAWVPCHFSTTDLKDLYSCDAVQFFTFGSKDEFTAPVVFSCNFDELPASRLVKPAPLEGFRVRLLCHISFAPSTPLPPAELKAFIESLAKKDLLRVHISGLVEVAGSA